MPPNYYEPPYTRQLVANAANAANDDEEDNNPAIYNINFDDNDSDSDSDSEDDAADNNEEDNAVQQDWSNFDYNEYINDINDYNDVVTSLKGHNGEL